MSEEVLARRIEEDRRIEEVLARQRAERNERRIEATIARERAIQEAAAREPEVVTIDWDNYVQFESSGDPSHYYQYPNF